MSTDFFGFDLIDKLPLTPVNSGQTTKRSSKIFTILVLSGILSLGASLSLLEAASANPGKVSQSDTAQLLKQKYDIGASDDTGLRLEKQQNYRATRLQPNLVNRVLRQLSRETSIPVDQLSVTDYSRETWPNGCLGLPQPGGFCTQALVEGWRIVVSDGSQNWVYRTDISGRILRLEDREDRTSSANLPQFVADAVLRNAKRRSRLPISALEIVEATEQFWPNGCLGFGGPSVRCTQDSVRGWLVVVASRQERWIYRTNESGSIVRLDETGSNISDSDTLTPTRIPLSDLPPPLSSNVVLRAIATGGISGDTSETIITKDGRVIRTVFTGRRSSASDSRSYTISRQQLRQVQDNLQQLSQFDRLDYRAARGSADYITVTLTSRFGTIRYADTVQNRLPEPLQEVVQAWNQVARRNY